MRKTFGFFAVVLIAGSFVAALAWAGRSVVKASRLQESVSIKAGARTVSCYLAAPEGKNNIAAVVVIHENMGLTDWVRSAADQLAAAGYVAIAPDLLSQMGPTGGGTNDFSDRNTIAQAINRLPPDQITSDLNAVADYVAKLQVSNGKVASAGFCWGGDQSFRFATNRPTLVADFVFYGIGPDDKDAIARIKCPVYGFYGGSDMRVTSTVTRTAQLMKEAGKAYEAVIYDGAAHCFMRSGEDPNPAAANKQAHDDAWIRWKSILKNL